MARLIPVAAAELIAEAVQEGAGAGGLGGHARHQREQGNVVGRSEVRSHGSRLLLVTFPHPLIDPPLLGGSV